MKASVVLCGIFFCLVPAAKVGAEPFTVLPDGSLVFNSSFATEGTFRCGSVVPCSASGTNSVTFGSGASAVTLTFTGVSTTVAVGNSLTPVSLGTFHTSSTGPAFTFPAVENPNASVVEFQLSMTLSSPVESTRNLFMSFGPGGGTALPLLESRSNYLGFPAGPNPPGFEYTSLVYTLNPFPFSLSGAGVTELTAEAGAVPEPMTLLLVGSGLALGAVSRRRIGRRAERLG